jgi:hypothetical protein
MGELDSTNPPSSREPAATQFSPPAFHGRPRAVNPLLPRRLAILFASSFVAFSLTTWFLARPNNIADAPHAANTAEGVIRQQFEAVSQGEMRVAYALFSPRYRSEVPFETFEETVRAHGAIFRATSVRKESEIETAARAEIKLRLETAGGDRFTARYTLIEIEGRWWIDEMRWHVDAPTADRILARDFENERPHANGRDRRGGQGVLHPNVDILRNLEQPVAIL